MNQKSLFDELREQVETDAIDSSGITLRPYQREAVQGVFDRWDAGDVATLVCCPTGCGKSVIFSEIMRQWVCNAS